MLLKHIDWHRVRLRTYIPIENVSGQTNGLGMPVETVIFVSIFNALFLFLEMKQFIWKTEISVLYPELKQGLFSKMIIP